VSECKEHDYIDELVYLYSKTGQMKRALYLIIDRLADVSRAIGFAKEQDDPDLWEDLLNYSMDKPKFIRGLLEEVGTSIDPITLVRRIPEGLEIPGLREGLKHIMKEHEIQYSISSGVARVLRSEVAATQSTLRNGQRKGIKFEVVLQTEEHVDVAVKDIPTVEPPKDANQPAAGPPTLVGEATVTTGPNPVAQPPRKHEPGHCAKCHKPFTEWETDTLVGFACAHVFHLQHLMELLYPGQDVDLGFGMDSEARSRRHTVGMKVTHARLLKDRIRGGCPVCIKREAPV
jgi:vacuolar protein sorting-associated protein 41